MASLADCIAAALAAGRITPEQAQGIIKTATDHARRARGQGAGQARLEIPLTAAQKALAAHRAQLAQQRYQLTLQALAKVGREADMRTHPGGVGLLDALGIDKFKTHPLVTGLFSLIDKDLSAHAGYDNIFRRAGGLSHVFDTMMAEVTDKLRSRWVGFVRDTKRAELVLREAMGEATGDEVAARLAKAWLETAELARELFNKAGGGIRKMEKWGMPQRHDRRLVQRMGREPWVRFVMERLDRERMVDDLGVAYSDEALEAMLSKTWDRITTDGLVDLEPGAMGGLRLANRHAEHRFLIFKDAGSWLEYHNRLGEGDIFNNMMAHLRGMANDIARIELFGPNPDTTFRYLRDVAKKEGGLEGITAQHLDATWNVASGKVSDSASDGLARVVTGTLNLLVSTKLGSSAITALSDHAFMATSEHWLGMSATKAMARYLTLLNPANEADRIMATRLGGGVDGLLDRFHTANRIGAVYGQGWTARFADITTRGTGLNAHTNAARWAFSWELKGRLWEFKHQALDQVDEPMRAALKKFGFTALDWDEIRSSTPAHYQGTELLSVENIIKDPRLRDGRGLELARKILGMQYELEHLAVPMPSTRARAIQTLGHDAGTLEGATTRTLMQFKSFPISAAMAHLYRGLNEATLSSRAKYLGHVIAGTTVFGALALQLTEIAKGRDPRDMTDPRFWGAAFMKGGGAGVYGDFVYAGLFGTNRYGATITDMLAGPAVGFATDVVSITGGSLGRAVDPTMDVNFAARLIRFGEYNTPFFSSAWYARAAFDRIIIDQAQELSDPRSRRRFAAHQRTLQKRYGQAYWWRPGEATPDRAPDITATAGND